MSYYHQQYHGNVMAPEQIMIDSKMQQHQQQPEVVLREKRSWSWCSMGCAVFSLIFCPFWVLCNVLGVVFSLTSYTDHKSADYERSANKRKCAWGCTITSIVLGLLTIVGICLIMFLTPWGILIWGRLY